MVLSVKVTKTKWDCFPLGTVICLLPLNLEIMHTVPCVYVKYEMLG